METTPATEIVDIVSSTVASRLKQVGEAFGDELKRQEVVWTEAVDKIDDQLRGEEGAHGVKASKSKKSVKSKSTIKSKGKK